MRLQCLCTANALCTLCQSVIRLRMMSAHLRNAGDKRNADVLINVAGELEQGLTESFKKRKAGVV